MCSVELLLNFVRYEAHLVVFFLLCTLVGTKLERTEFGKAFDIQSSDLQTRCCCVLRISTKSSTNFMFNHV